MNFLSQYMSRFRQPPDSDYGQLPNGLQHQFHANTGGPGQMQGFNASTGGVMPPHMGYPQQVHTGGDLPPMGMPTMHPSMGGGLPPMQHQVNTGGGLPAMLGGFHAGTGGYDAPSQFHANTGGGMPPQAFNAHTGGGLPPQAQGQGFGLRSFMDWGRRMGGRSY